MQHRRCEQIVAVLLRTLLLRGFALIFPQALDLARDDQLFILAKRDAVFGSKTFGPFSDEINVRALVKYLLRGANRVPDALHATHTAGAQRSPIHHERIALHAAVPVEKTAAAGIEGVIILEHDHGCLNRIHG